MSFFLTPKTLARSQVVDQIFPVLSDNLAIMIPYPKVENGISLPDSSSLTIVNMHHELIKHALMYNFNDTTWAKTKKLTRRL